MYQLNEIHVRIMQIEEIISSNDRILRNGLCEMPPFPRDRKKRMGIRESKSSIMSSLKILSFFSFFILSAILLLLSYQDNVTSLERNESQLLSLANISR